MKTFFLSICILSAALFTGCASYQAPSLSALDPKFIKTCSEVEGIAVGCKAYSKQDCYDYLDRDVIKNGYQPIQLTFQNNSDKRYIFSTQNVSLPCASIQDVAKTAHTSTVGRVVGYSIGGILAWPLFIPAVVDGIKSFNANIALDKDFDDKAKQQFVIAPGLFAKTLIFIPKADFQPMFDITLVEEETGLHKIIKMSVVH